MERMHHQKNRCHRYLSDASDHAAVVADADIFGPLWHANADAKDGDGHVRDDDDDDDDVYVNDR